MPTQAYRPRRPAATVLHRTVREHLETYLDRAGCDDDLRSRVPSCATRRMVETAAHLVDQVLPRVGYRQWVLSVPKRVRWHLREKPEAASGLLRVFLRAVGGWLLGGRNYAVEIPLSCRSAIKNDLLC